jgi:hypothetical protein
VSALCRGTLEIGSDAIARVELQGVLTPGNLPDVQVWIADAALSRSNGAVVDYRATVVGVDAEALCAQTRAATINVPLAAIVTREASAVFREWAWQRALEGVMRSVFRDETRALAWVRDWASVRRG